MITSASHQRSLILVVCLLLASALAASNSRPAKWGFADESSWPTLCRDGHEQSPLDFRHTVVRGRSVNSLVVVDPNLTPVFLSKHCRFLSSDFNISVTNTFHAIEMRWVATKAQTEAEAATPQCFARNPVTGGRCYFERLVWRVGAEHRFAGPRQALELHLVFRCEDAPETPVGSPAALLILAVPIRLLSPSDSESGAGRHAVSALLLSTPSLPSEGSSTVIASWPHKTFALEELLPSFDTGYIAYQGSLVEPPCTEGVQWIVFTSSQVVTRSAYSALFVATAAVVDAPNGNVRASQEYWGRKALRYLDPFGHSGKAHWELANDGDHADEYDSGGAPIRGTKRLVPSGGGGGSGAGANVPPPPPPPGVSDAAGWNYLTALLGLLVCVAAVAGLLHYMQSRSEAGRVRPQANAPSREAATYGSTT